jgi:hypothetical protein
VRWLSFAKLLATAAAIILSAAASAQVEVAMVTSLQGKVSRTSPMGPQPVQVFAKLKHGDQLALEKGSVLQVVYFDNGREETWRGAGKLEIARADSMAKGMAAPQVRMLPAVMVKQIAKTPALDSQGRAGMMRVRGVASAEDIASVEATYQTMRQERKGNDIKPELYFLSAMFELREFDRVESAVSRLQGEQPGNADVALVAQIYTKAVKNARAAQ